MSGAEFEIKTESIDIKEEWQIDLNQPNVKKENEINDETKGHFAPPEDLNFVKFPKNMSDAALPRIARQAKSNHRFFPTVASAKTAPKAKKASKPKAMRFTRKKAPEPAHPHSTVMIVAAVKALKARKGSSLAAIKVPIIYFFDGISLSRQKTEFLHSAGALMEHFLEGIAPLRHWYK